MKAGDRVSQVKEDVDVELVIKIIVERNNPRLNEGVNKWE